MALLEWNIKGLKGAKTKRDVLTVMNKFRIEIIGLLESRVRRRNQSKVMREFERQWSGCLNFVVWEEEVANSIWVLWNPQIWIVDIQVIHKQLIHGCFRNCGGLELLVTFVYVRGTEV